MAAVASAWKEACRFGARDAPAMDGAEATRPPGRTIAFGAERVPGALTSASPNAYALHAQLERWQLEGPPFRNGSQYPAEGPEHGPLGHAGGYFFLRAEMWEILADEMRGVVVTRVQHGGSLRRSRSLEERLMVRFPGACERWPRLLSVGSALARD